MSTIELIVEESKKLFALLDDFSDDTKMDAINEIKQALHKISPMRHEPVDCVLWVRNDLVHANTYNPNNVAPPEMTLLETSIATDGYTQPIVAWREAENRIEVVDGFHRNLIGKNSEAVKARVKGYLPIVLVNTENTEQSARMASTIRHNRARGTHNIELMSTIVSELVEMGKGDRWISTHLGMSMDELLRLKQITGVAALFANRDFSDSWEAELTEEDLDRQFDEEQVSA